LDFRVWIITVTVAAIIKIFDIGGAAPYRELQLNGEWKFNTGYSASADSEDMDDSSWYNIQVPSAWEDQGFADYDGIAWYRRSFEIPAGWKSAKGLAFDIGKIDDEDKVYFNGHLIGSSSGWKKWRKYNIPRSLVRFGEKNTIAIMVNDTGGNGGLWDGPVKIVTGLAERFNTEEY